MTTPIEGNLLRGHLEALVLSVLSDGDSHGFEILKRLDRRGEGAFSLKEGTLYPVLYRLEHQGLVKARWEESAAERRGPRRRVYSLTRKGRTALERRRHQWQQFVSVVGGIILPPEQATAHCGQVAIA